jgi:hypothetical protein
MRYRLSQPLAAVCGSIRGMRKIIIGGLLGGVTLFVWSFIAHLPPLGTAGERKLPAPVLAAMQPVLQERAVYISPPLAAPSAVVAYDPHPAKNVFAWFGIELLADFAAAFLGAMIAVSLSPTLGHWQRALILAAVGLLATIDIDLGYWNWYAYPTSYLAAQFVDHVGGWFVTGKVLARVSRPS